MAAAFALNTQSAESLGAATAGAQAAEATPGNIYFNPAAIVGVEGLEGSLSVVGVLNNSRYSNAEGVLLGTVPVSGQSAGEAPLDDGVLRFMRLMVSARPMTTIPFFAITERRPSLFPL